MCKEKSCISFLLILCAVLPGLNPTPACSLDEQGVHEVVHLFNNNNNNLYIYIFIIYLML